MKRFVRTVLAVVMLLCIVSTSASAAYKAKVLSTSMPLYLTSDCSGSPIGRIKHGASVSVLKFDGSHACIRYKGYNYFVSMRHLIFSKKIRAVVQRDVKMTYATKKSYSYGKAYKGKLLMGTKVYIVGRYRDKVLIENKTGNILAVVPKSAVMKY